MLLHAVRWAITAAAELLVLFLLHKLTDVAGGVYTGKILTIETVPLKLPKKQWKGPEINPDQTCFQDEYMRHLLYITRIYFHYGLPEPELIGTPFKHLNNF